MSLFHSLLADAGPPPIPTSFDVAFFADNSTARVGTRQVSLEPSVAAADRARSYSIWVHQSNLSTTAMRFMGCAEPANTNQQFVLQTNAQSDASNNQLLSFVLFDASNNIIGIRPNQKFLRNRWYHIVVTYTGSELNTGLEIYLNGVLVTDLTRTSSGTYAGARDSATLRYCFSRMDASASRYIGDMRDATVWNRVLTGAEVTEIFNGGVPLASTSASFWGSTGIAYWPLQSDLTCANNATFNLGTSAGITFRNIPLSPTYEQISFWNAYPGQTRYLAFGGMYKNGSNFVVDTRSGTDHVANGKIVKCAITPSTLSVAAPVDILTDSDDLRNLAIGPIDGNVGMFLTQYSHPTFIANERYESTDGLTGETFGAAVNMPTTLTAASFYGAVIAGDLPGEYLVAEYEFTSPSTYEVNVWKRSSGGTWSKIQVYTGAGGYTETNICRVATNTYFLIARSNTQNGLFISISTDGGSTWSAFTSTGLGSGTCMGAMALAPDGSLTLVYADRGIDRLVIVSNSSVAAIIADPTDWGTVSEICSGYSTDSTGILGYPAILYDGFNCCIAFSNEWSSSRADLYVGYGVLGFGV